MFELLETYRRKYPQGSTIVRETVEEIDLDFIETDLTKILKSMTLGSDRIRNLVLSLRTFNRGQERPSPKPSPLLYKPPDCCRIILLLRCRQATRLKR